MKALIYATPLTGHLVIDDDYDHRHASDGFSRFGAYLAMRLPAVLEDDPDVMIDPVRWASFAWATATTPVMSPGYLTWTGPIEDIQVGWDDGYLAVETILRTRLPSSLPGWRGWDWDREGNHREPWYGDRTALTRVTLRARLVDVRLPAPPEDVLCRTEVVLTAKATIASVATAIDGLLVPALAALYGRCPTGLALPSGNVDGALAVQGEMKRPR